MGSYLAWGLMVSQRLHLPLHPLHYSNPLWTDGLPPLVRNSDQRAVLGNGPKVDQTLLPRPRSHCAPPDRAEPNTTRRDEEHGGEKPSTKSLRATIVEMVFFTLKRSSAKTGDHSVSFRGCQGPTMSHRRPMRGGSGFFRVDDPNFFAPTEWERTATAERCGSFLLSN